MAAKHYRVNKKSFARFIIIIIAIIAAVAFIIVHFGGEKTKSVFSFLEKETAAEPVTTEAPAEVAGIPFYQVLLPENYAGRPGIKRDIKYIVIHETANHDAGADAASHSNYLMQEAKETEISWHYTVDDHQIYQNLPDDEVGWHAGDSTNEPGGNMNGIGVEICVNDDGDFEQAKDNAAKLTAYLLDKYSLSIDAVKQHHDFMEKDCPMTIRDEGQWEGFAEKVKSYM